MSISNNPVGFFDSGVGGLSVLKEAIKIMPNESFIYLGDSKNAPYGTKTVEQVKQLSINAAEFLVKKNVKAIVVACNTATSAAIKELRNLYKDIPVIGIEPALKPAVELNREGKILIMATPMTLAEKKFNKLMNRYKNIASIEPVPCAGLAELIESGKIEHKETYEYIYNKLKKYKEEKISSVVLGCTHYPFVAHIIKEFMGEDIPIIDGGKGTAGHLKRKLKQLDLISNSENGNVEIFNSLNDSLVELSYDLLER